MTTFFEGTEKKVEFVVKEGTPSLRRRGDNWMRVIEAARAQVLSELHTDECDAYLLSESSLFVFDDYAVMITCGQTTLVDAVSEILHFVGREAIAFLVYERKNELFPDRQNTSFYDDAKQLHQWIPGKALRFGGSHGHHVNMFCTTQPFVPESDDPTLEVLMHDIDQQVAAQFSADSSVAGTSVASRVGLGPMLEGFEISEHVFSPAGYSLNALNGPVYFTVHVTPETVGSYVSVETNQRFGDPNAFVRALAEIFCPRAFDVVSFLPNNRLALDVPGFRLADHASTELGGYGVDFFQYHQPTEGPRPPYEFVL